MDLHWVLWGETKASLIHLEPTEKDIWRGVIFEISTFKNRIVIIHYAGLVIHVYPKQ